jgi:hypothetical protein
MRCREMKAECESSEGQDPSSQSTHMNSSRNVRTAPRNRPLHRALFPTPPCPLFGLFDDNARGGEFGTDRVGALIVARPARGLHLS